MSFKPEFYEISRQNVEYFKKPFPSPWKMGLTINPEFVLMLAERLEELYDKPKCECGAEVAHSPRHSTWCPEYEGKIE